MSWTIESTDPHGESWQHFLAENDHLLFHEGVWSDVVKDGIASRILCLICKQDGQAKAGALGFMIGGFGIQIAYFNYPYGGLIGNLPPTEILVDLLKEFCTAKGICQLQLIGFPGSVPFNSDEFEIQPDTTHILNLEGKTVESLWTGYRRSRRQDIRKAKERGITVEQISNDDEIDLVHEFYLQTMQRTKGVARYKKQLLRSIVHRLGPKGRARMYVAKINEEPIAGMLIVDSKRLSHGLLLAASNAGLKHQPNKLLLHTAAEDCTLKGMHGLDYMPSGQSASGVSNFKNLWGAEEVKLEHATLRTMPLRSFCWRIAYSLAKRQPMRMLLTLLRK